MAEGYRVSVVLKADRAWTAEDFIATDQHRFGDAWRYELVNGQVVGHAAPAPDHGAILAGLTRALVSRRTDMPKGCRPESGSAATPTTVRRNTARIPDAMVRCGQHPRVAFEVVSPSEVRGWRDRDRKRLHMQAVEGIEELVEIFQADYAIHVYRRLPGGAWSFEALGGRDATLRLESLGLTLPLAEIYALVDLPDTVDPAGTQDDPA